MGPRMVSELFGEPEEVLQGFWGGLPVLRASEVLETFPLYHKNCER